MISVCDLFNERCTKSQHELLKFLTLLKLYIRGVGMGRFWAIELLGTSIIVRMLCEHVADFLGLILQKYS